MLILCTNDDGYRAPGLAVSVKAAQSIIEKLGGDVVVYAPLSQHSGHGARTTFGKPIPYEQKKWNSIDVYVVNGTPSDAVRFALLGHGLKPDLVVSGINHGVQLGTSSIVISGTCGAILTVAALGFKGIALGYETIDMLRMFSEHDANQKLTDSEYPGSQLERILSAAIETKLYNADIWNVNFPAKPTQEIKVCPTIRYGFYNDVVHIKNGAFINRGEPSQREFSEGTDAYYFKQGYITLSPLKLEFYIGKELLEKTQELFNR